MARRMALALLALMIGIAPAVAGRLWETDYQKAAAAAARCVLTSANAAFSFEASALPALNPNQPNQSMPAPSSVRVRL